MMGTSRGLKLVGVLAFMVGVLALGEGTPHPAYAAATWITPSPVNTFIVNGVMYGSGATLTEAISGQPNYVNIHISDQTYLREGWVVKVDHEKMLVRDLIEGGVGNPDTMVVFRGWEGTYSAAHAQNGVIKGPTVTVDIWAKDVSDPYGVGAFQVQVTLPENLEMIKFVSQTSWLSSTGRVASCLGSQLGPRSWEVHCSTWGATPPGPNGSGIIAKLTVVRPASGSASVYLDGSFLLNAPAETIPTSVQDMSFRVVDCPDVDGNGSVGAIDAFQTALQWQDRGRDCGVSLWSATDQSQTTLQINDQSLAWWNTTVCAAQGTNRPSHIAIDNEIMAVGTFTENGQPDTVSVTRGAYSGYASPARPHEAGRHVYLAPTQWDGNNDGRNGYTPSRDVDHNNWITLSDTYIVASVLGMQCQ